MSTRLEINADVVDLIEDSTDLAYPPDRINRHIQRAVEMVHQKLVTIPGVDYARGVLTFTMVGKSFLLAGLDDMQLPRHLRRPVSDIGDSFGRALTGEVNDEYATIIPESQRRSSEHANGIDSRARRVCFFTNDISTPENPWTIHFLLSTSGVWDLVYTKSVTKLVPGSADDGKIYETIPDPWIIVVAHRAAITLLHNHQEEAPGLIAALASIEGDLLNVARLGNASGSVQQQV